MFYNIALSGGGAYTLVFIGSLKYLEEAYMDISIKNYIGASAGAIFCLLMIIGYTSKEMEELAHEILIEPNSIQYSFSNLMKVFKTYGIDNGDHIIKIMSNLLERKGFDKNATFLDISKRTGKNLIIAVANITQQKIEYLSVDNYPEMRITTAIRMSTCIPILYEPVKYYDDLYVDSLVFNNFPIIFFDKFKIETLGLNVYSEKKTKANSFFEYMHMIFYSVKQSLDQLNKTSHPYVCNLPSVKNKSKMFDFYKMKISISEEFVKECINVGYNKLKVFIQESK